MAWSLQSTQTKRRTQIVAIDLGTRTTKAVWLQRKGTGWDLARYAIQEAPVYEREPAPELVAVHLKTVLETLGAKTRQVVLVAGVNDTLLRHAEVPFVPVEDMRLMLKFNSKSYLQQDLPDYVFDCYVLPPRLGAKPAEVLKPNQKCRVLVGGAKKQFVERLQAVTKHASLTADLIAPSLITVANAFEMAEPELFQKEVVALVEIGFRSSSISILANGELALSRVVAFGGDKLTNGLADALNVSYAEAEGIKIGMPEEVHSALVPLLLPLGRELRASIDFFEHQQDKPVSQVFVSGGSARSRFLMETLQSELMVPCKAWNPVSFLNLALSPEQRGELEQVSPQLTVATGGAVTAL